MTDHVYTHELLREGEWTNDGRMLATNAVTWWEQIPLVYEEAILGVIGNIRREGNRIYGDTDVEIPEDAVVTASVDSIEMYPYDEDRMVMTGARLNGANVSEKGSYPWHDNEEEGGEADGG